MIPPPRLCSARHEMICWRYASSFGFGDVLSDKWRFVTKLKCLSSGVGVAVLDSLGLEDENEILFQEKYAPKLRTILESRFEMDLAVEPTMHHTQRARSDNI